jgi:hypothetical protein
MYGGWSVRILLVHNRRRSLLPSGENRVVDQEAQALAEAGHEIERFERNSDDSKSSTLVGVERRDHPRGA